MEASRQIGLAFENDRDSTRCERLSLPDAEVEFFPRLFPTVVADRMLARLLSETPWEQESINYYGKRHNLPRLTCWFGDLGAHYTYSNIAKEPRPWTALLQEIKEQIEIACHFRFNSVLLNLYRTGADAVSWHQDNERELGDRPTIASLSVGQDRVFQMRHVSRADLPRIDILLNHGSLLVMRGTTQEYWKHQIPRTARRIGQRINLTFRFIRSAR